MNTYIAITSIIFVLHVGLTSAQEQETYYCGGKPADVYFLLDSSTSIWFLDYEKQIKFVSELIEIFEIAADKTRIGLGTFSDDFYPQFNFKDYNNKTDIIKTVQKTKQSLGGTNTAEAIRRMREEEFSSNMARQDVAHIAIILTDGKSWSTTQTALQARLSKEKGMYVFAIGIGNSVDIKELNGIASQSDDKNSQFVFHVKNFDALDSIKEILAIKTCEVVPNDQYRCGVTGHADIIFVLDRLVMGPSRSQLIKEFIAGAADLLDMGPDNPIRIGVFTNNCPITKNIHLDDHNDKYSFISELKSTNDMPTTHILKRVRKQGFSKSNGARPEARKLIVFFVDGPISNPKSVLLEAQKVQNSDIELFVVTIGNEYLEKEVMMLASSKTRDHTVRVPSYPKLNDSLSDFVNLICEKL